MNARRAGSKTGYSKFSFQVEIMHLRHKTEVVFPAGTRFRIQKVADNIHRIFVDVGAYKDWYTYFNDYEVQRCFRIS